MAAETDPHNDAAVQRAVAALSGQRPEEAEQIAATVLKTEPRHARALYVLGAAQLMRGRVDEAIASLEKAALGNRDAETDTMLAIALRRAGRDGDALSRLKRVVKRQPHYASAILELGDLLVALDRHNEAIETLRRGLDVAPMMPQLWIQLGYVFLARRKCSDAKAAFARALGISPDAPNALHGMARSHQELGESATAAEYFRRCLVLRPQDTDLWLSLGLCLLELGQRDAGYDCLRTAARGDRQRYGTALASLAASGRGRFWLRPSAAKRFLRAIKD